MKAIIANTEKEIAKVKHNKLWFKRATVDFPLTDEQYEIFKKGYAPDWDCRFAPVYMDGWFYITRSGYWLFKFKYERKKDGLWHITSNYDTGFTPGYAVMLNVIHEGYFEPQIFTERDIKRYMDALKNTARLPLAVEENPKSCVICHSKVKPVTFGEPTPETWRKIERGQIIDYGCCVGEDYPEWMCPTCGQGYKNRHDKWNADADTLIYLRRPKVCKKCGGEVLGIVYGYPSREISKMAERGEIILGGFCIEGKQPDMVCRDCHQRYRKSYKESNGDEDAAMDLLSEDFGVLEAKVMGVTGAMNRGVPKSEALKKYGLTEQEYNEGYNRVFSDEDL